MQLYSTLASWWPVLSPVDDYADESAFFLELIDEAGIPADATLLEFGAGGGNNAVHMKRRFSNVTLSDLSEDMLRVSREINPECRHLTGDMRTLDVGEVFDVVFIHDAIDYMTTREDLFAVIRNAYRHCKPDGIVMLVPDYVDETYVEKTDHGGSDAADRHLRYLEWGYDPDPTDHETIVNYVVVHREGAGPIQIVHEQHRCGLFDRATWFEGLLAAGFAPRSVTDDYERDVFIGRRTT